jgi:hypothetical protein
MILAKETTEWVCDNPQPNHTYLMSDNMTKVYGYFKWHDPKQFQMLRTPLTIDKRYRQFKVLQKNIKDMK